MDNKTSHKRRVTSEDDLKAWAAEDDYKRKKLVMDCLTWAAVAVVVGAAVLLVYEIWTSSMIRTALVNTMVNNIAGIIIAVFAILGLRPKN